MWQTAIKIGDYILKDPGVGILVYQKVLKMTRSPQKLRFVEGFSCMDPFGEMGDTAIHDVVCIISPELWKDLEDMNFPAQIPLPVTFVTENRSGTHLPMMILDKMAVN